MTFIFFVGLGVAAMCFLLWVAVFFFGMGMEHGLEKGEQRERARKSESMSWCRGCSTERDSVTGLLCDKCRAAAKGGAS